MKTLSLTAATACLIATLALTSQQPPATAFVGVNVMALENETVLKDQTVVVRGGRIEALGPAAKTAVPAGATRIEAKGKSLMPALAEMHAHIPPGKATDEEIERVLFLYA